MEKKKDGGAYEPGTLQLFQRRLQQYLNKSSKINILQDHEFQKSLEVLSQLVVEEAKCTRQHVEKELSNAEEDQCSFAQSISQ